MKEMMQALDDFLVNRKPGIPGTLVAIEGFDGAGKTTQLNLAAKALELMGFDVLKTRQPTEKYRQNEFVKTFLRSWGSLADAEKVARLSALDRAAHVNDVIVPAMREGKVVLCDRYVFSFFALNQFRGLDPVFLQSISGKLLKPDVTIFIDVPPAELVKRIRSRNTDSVKFEEAEIERIATIRNNFMNYQTYFYVMNGLQAPDVIHEQIMASIVGSLPKKS